MSAHEWADNLEATGTAWRPDPDVALLRPLVVAILARAVRDAKSSDPYRAKSARLFLASDWAADLLGLVLPDWNKRRLLAWVADLPEL